MRNRAKRSFLNNLETEQFTSIDPLFEKYAGWTPYQYSMNNPVNMKDDNGKSVFNLGKDDGSGDYGIMDGSNAVYSLSGKDEYKHFVFTGFDETQIGENKINLTTAIQEAQILNMNNQALQPHYDKSGDLETHCNFGTQNILRTVESTGISGAYITGNANSMNKKLNGSDAFVETNKPNAIKNAREGGLSLYSLQKQGHGHIGTFSVGINISKGDAANIGTHNRFQSLDNRNYQFFILKP